MTTTLPLMLEERTLTTVPSDLLIAPFFESDRPLLGPAGQTDWRLCGMLSRLLLEGRTKGALGDAVLVPTLGRMRAPRVLLLGLGPRPTCSEMTLRSAGRLAAGRVLDLGARVPALALPPERLLPLEVSAVVRGWIGGVAEMLAERQASLALRIVAPPGEASALRAALVRLAARPPGDLVIRLMPEAGQAPDAAEAGPQEAVPREAGPAGEGALPGQRPTRPRAAQRPAPAGGPGPPEPPQA